MTAGMQEILTGQLLRHEIAVADKVSMGLISSDISTICPSLNTKSRVVSAGRDHGKF